MIFFDKLFNSKFYHILCLLCIGIYYAIGLYDFNILESYDFINIILVFPCFCYLYYLLVSFLLNYIKRS